VHTQSLCDPALSPNFGDGRDQAAAAWACSLTTSIPSVNLTPRIIFGNWVVAIEATPAFRGGLGELEVHSERGLV